MYPLEQPPKRKTNYISIVFTFGVVLVFLCGIAIFVANPRIGNLSSPTPTPTKTPRPETAVGNFVQSTLVPAALQVMPTSTPAKNDLQSPVNMVAAERLFKVLVLQGFAEDSMRKSATDMQTKKSDGIYSLNEAMFGLGELTFIGIVLKSADEGLKYDYPIDLTDFKGIAQKQQDTLSSILGRWLDKKISSSNIAQELQPLDATKTMKDFASAMPNLGLNQTQIKEVVKNTEENMQAMSDALNKPKP